jgi:dephospho-CoA kinase
MFIAGLTGNFGMGKSSVLSLFSALGAVTLDTDRIVAHLLDDDSVVRQIGELLGRDVIRAGGTLDKKAVAQRIFSDVVSRRKLETLLHPLVFAEIDRFMDKIGDRDCIVVIEVPLLFEGEHGDRFRKVITVYTPEETAVRRLIKSGLQREQATARMKTQLSIETKKALADYTIDNGGTREETKQQVEEIYRSLISDMKAAVQNREKSPPKSAQRSQRED